MKHHRSPNLAAPISRRAVLSLAALVAPAGLIRPASATPVITPGDVTLVGQLLIATPVMEDPRFARTVILMVRHSKAGAMGIAINRPIAQRPLVDLLRAMGQDESGVDGTIGIFAGGPVQPQIGFILHDAEYNLTGTIDIDGRVAVTSDPQILRDIGRHAGPRKYLVAFGYAGWGPRQLEAELALHAWVTTAEDPDLVFDTDRDTVWDAATARAGHGR